MTTETNKTKSEEEMREAFKLFDKDGKGFITASEFRYLITKETSKLEML